MIPAQRFILREIAKNKNVVMQMPRGYGRSYLRTFCRKLGIVALIKTVEPGEKITVLVNELGSYVATNARELQVWEEYSPGSYRAVGIRKL